MKFKRLLSALLFASVSAASSDATALNLISNGSFEDPVPTSNGGLWQVYTSINGWQTPLNYIEIQRNGLFGSNPANQAPDGSQWTEVDAPGAGTALRQIVTTEAGAKYSLSFYYSGRPGYGYQELAVYWNNSLVSSVNNALTVSAQNLSWTRYAFDIVATSGTGTLTFASLNNLANSFGAGGNLLDNVSLTKTGSAEVPEPASLLLLGSGVLFSRRIRRVF